jgi:hypothetical protein
LKGEEVALKDTKLQENNQELEKEKQELETQVELSPNFSTLESRRQNLLEKVSSLSFHLSFCTWSSELKFFFLMQVFC